VNVQDDTVKILIVMLYRVCFVGPCKVMECGWVNFLALNVDYVLRTGAFDPAKGGSNPPNSVCSGEQRLFVYLAVYKELAY